MTHGQPPYDAAGGREVDRIHGTIACLDTANLPATLISTVGSHCEVWQQAGRIRRGGGHEPLDLVIKKFRTPCSYREARVYAREYRILREALGEIIPATRFVHTKVDGEPSVVVIARTHTPWFNLANPANEEEAVPLLRRLGRARDQLHRFTAAARGWHGERDPRVIDLFGADNLVLDRGYQLRYLDSFGVFFHESLLHLLAEVDEELKYKIDLSLRRLDYLEYLLSESGG